MLGGEVVLFFFFKTLLISLLAFICESDYLKTEIILQTAF